MVFKLMTLKKLGLDQVYITKVEYHLKVMERWMTRMMRVILTRKRRK